MAISKPEEVYKFWFESGLEDKRAEKDPEFDELIWDKFGETWQAACQGLLYEWRATAKGRLAEIIVLDQFSRNLNRGSAKSYSQDLMSLALAQELIKLDEFQDLTPEEKHFTYLALMHVESQALHEKLIKLYEEPEMSEHYDKERIHKELIDRFGRYPHRNEVLGRESTTEELIFLNKHGNMF